MKKAKRLMALVFAGLLVGSIPGWALSLALRPPSYDIIVNPGGLRNFVLRVDNTDPDSSIAARLYAETISVDEVGDVTFLSQKEYPKGCGSWILPQKRAIRIGPSESVNVPIRLRVPPGIPSGGYYAAIIVEPDDGRDIDVETGLKLAFRLAAIVRITVRGSTPLRREAKVADFVVVSGPLSPESEDLKKERGPRNFVAQEFPDTEGLFLVTRLKNTGNIHIVADGSAFLRDSSKRRRGSSEFQSGTGVVYPGAGRYFVAKFPYFLPEDEYTAQLRFRYPGAPPLTVDKTFTIEVALGSDQEDSEFHFSALHIIPREIEATVSPGSYRTGKCSLVNRLRDPLRVKAFAEGVAGEWVRLIKDDIMLRPGIEKDFVFRLAIPSDAKAGEHEVFIVFTNDDFDIERKVPIKIFVR